MAHGTIHRLASRGFGFIADGSDHEVFFHSSALIDVAFTDLRRGDRVTFEKEHDPHGRGDRAANVHRLHVQAS